MLQDTPIVSAVSRVLQRSEKQEDIEKLIGTFVDVGILPLLENDNNQIIYGRRGTGKTHVLKVLGSKIENNDPKNTVVYIDARTLGSTAQFSDPDVPIGKRCLALFRDFLTPIQNDLMEHIIERPPHNAEQAFDAASELASIIVEPVKLYHEQEITTSESVENIAAADAHASIGSEKKSIEVGATTRTSDSSSVERKYDVKSEDKVVFPALHQALSIILKLAETKLFILLDEWASLPRDIQPFLAEFIKRGILPVPNVVLKIASLEYRSRFSVSDEEKIIGFELGADIATAPELDDYYVYDRNPNIITDIYAKMLWKHLSADLEENYLNSKYSINSQNDFITRLFTEKSTFQELSRAAEGVARDLINIFTYAFYGARRRGRTNIDRKAVTEAARQWFEQDKAQHLDHKLQIALRRIVDDVIGTRQARSFLLPRDLEKHPMVLRLFDARVLHHMQRGYADKDNPGVRYNIYTLDYGTYVDLLGTSKQPQISMFQDDTLKDIVVPYDDKRSIRRIVLNAEILEVGDN